jgi:hypothetical protein
MHGRKLELHRSETLRDHSVRHRTLSPHRLSDSEDMIRLDMSAIGKQAGATCRWYFRAHPLKALKRNILGFAGRRADLRKSHF